MGSKTLKSITVSLLTVLHSGIALGHLGESDAASIAANSERATETALMPIEDCEEIVRLRNLERNAAGLGPVSDSLVARYYRRFCITTDKVIGGGMPRRNEHSLVKDLRASKRFADRAGVARYVEATYPSMPRQKRERLVEALMAAKSLDGSNSTKTVEIQEKSRRVN